MVDDVESRAMVTRSAKTGWIANPTVLGLYALAGATFLMATRWLHWYVGSGHDSMFLVLPFSALLGGITFLAGMWAFETADAPATVIFSTWGVFWSAYGLLGALFVSGRLSQPGQKFPEMGFWFIVAAAITWVVAATAASESVALSLTFGLLAAGSTLAAIAYTAGRVTPGLVAGWLFVISAIVGWYTATAILLEGTFHRAILPLGAFALTDRSPQRQRIERAPMMPDTPAPRRVG